MVGQRIYGIEAGAGVQLGNVQPIRVSAPQGWGTIGEFGGTGAGDETGVIAAAEASAYDHINLQTKTLRTSVSADSLTKKYFNGRLIALGDSGNQTDVHPFWPTSDNELERSHWKTFRFEWAGAKILWLGTSIVHLGSGVDGYAEQTAKVLGATVSNMAWAGSHMYWDPDFDPYNETQATQELGSLAMTEDDRLRGMALYPGSGYDDASPFMPVGGPSTMTCDYRIAQQFDLTPFDTVILDHCHNDRAKPAGVLDTPALPPISAIAKGTTTTVTLATSGLVAVGDGVALEVVGIAKLNHAAGMVTAVAGNTFTLNIDSSGFAGAFTSGNAYRYDRATAAGSCQFLIHYIKNCAIRRDLPEPMIILAGAPSEFTAASTELVPPIDAMVWGCAQTLKAVARKWALPFFDIAYYLDISARDHWYYFPDGVHPNTAATRRVISDYWVQWLRGGAPAPWGESNVLLRGSEAPHLDGHAAEYSTIFRGFQTPAFKTRAPVTIFTENFATIGGFYGVIGTAPVVQAAPWGSGSSIRCVAANPAMSALSLGLALPSAWQYEFDLYLPNLPPVTAPGIAAATIDVVQFRAAAGIHYIFQLIAAPSWTDVQARVVWFNGPDTDMRPVPGAPISLKPLIKYRIRIMAVRAGASYQGAVMLWVDDVLLAGPGLTSDASQPDVATIILGVNWYNTGNTVTLNLSNVVVSTVAVDDYTQRYTGNVVVGAQTMHIVNGVITSVAP